MAYKHIFFLILNLVFLVMLNNDMKYIGILDIVLQIGNNIFITYIYSLIYFIYLLKIERL